MSTSQVLVRYRKRTLIGGALVFGWAGLIATGSFWMSALGWLLIGFAARLARLGMSSDDAAIRWDGGDTVTIRSLWKTTRVALVDYERFDTEATWLHLGVIPVPAGSNVVFHYGSGLLGRRRIRLPLLFLRLSQPGVAMIAEALDLLALLPKTLAVQAREEIERRQSTRPTRGHDPLMGKRGPDVAPQFGRRAH